MPLFKGHDDHDWTMDRMSNGEVFRWRVRRERIRDIKHEYKEFLEATARQEGQTLEQYVEWVANLSTARMHETRDRIMDGRASEREATLYNCWLEARRVVQEVQYLFELRPGKFDWR